jgi:small subunit ribosomal protein S18
MAVVRKISSKPKTENVEATEAQQVEVKESATKAAPRRASDSRESSQDSGREETTAKQKKKCVYCETKVEPHYWDSAALRRFVSDRGRIHGRSRSGLCSKHQKRAAREIKHARHLALLPFIVRV